MTRLTMLIDIQRCIGCWSCNVACKQENGVPPGVTRNQLFTVGPFGEYPDVKAYFLSGPACTAKTLPVSRIAQPAPATSVATA